MGGALVSAFDVSDSLFKQLAANTTEFKNKVIPAGETWEVLSFHGSGAYVTETEICLVWAPGSPDEEIVAATHGDAKFIVNRQFEGDGQKALSIHISNQGEKPQALGGAYTAIRL